MATQRAKTAKKKKREKQAISRLVSKVRKLEAKLFPADTSEYSDYERKPRPDSYWYTVCQHLKPHELKLILDKALEAWYPHNNKLWNVMKDAAQDRLFEIEFGLVPETKK